MNEFISVVHFMRFLGKPAFVVAGISICIAVQTSEAGGGVLCLVSPVVVVAVALLGITLVPALAERDCDSLFEQDPLPKS